ncbi:P-loop containing nucleoside triphosphate hydrolase protein [Hyaloscypha variabilis]
MPLAIRRSGQCAFCAFRNTGWLASPPWHPLQQQNGARHFSGKIRRIRPPPLESRPRLDRPSRPPPPRSLRARPMPLRITAEHQAEGAYRPFLRTETTYGVFGKLLSEQVSVLRSRLQNRDQHLIAAWGITSDRELEEQLTSFEKGIEECRRRAEEGVVSKADNPLFYRLRQAFVLGNVKELAAEMKYAFINHVVSSTFTTQDQANQDKLADLRYPVEWFPATRALQRTVHLHVGPTNSGKTYHALQRLEAAETGIYAGPLRLLAHEVYSRFNAKGKPCALVTGEERRVPEAMTNFMSSCTVEMVPLNSVMDVAVIDEIQMMSDAERGWAWTQAFLGVQAKEVHLCGEVRTIQLVTDLCKSMGDTLIIHRYERLSPLKMERQSLNGDLSRLQKGDAVILFSRVAIHAMKADIERTTGKRCAVVYGSLPPETRAQQAALFNDPNNDYDFLVASDAVGMGLNLSIKRIIFEATSKHDGIGFRLIRTSEIKQIAGRAGRFKTASDAIQKSPSEGVEAVQPEKKEKPVKNIGLVTTLENFDLPIVKKAMETEVEPLKTAGIFPPSNILLRFANYFPPKTPFSYIVLRLHEISSLHPRFHLCRLKEQIEVADLIQPYDLTNMDRIIFMSAPVAIREPGFADVITEFAECVAKQTGGELLNLRSLNLEMLDMDIHAHPEGTKGYLKEAEALHKALTLYLWLSYRFAGIFRSQALAFHVKSLVEEKIDQCLGEVHFDASKRKQLTKLRQRAVEDQVIEMEAAEDLGQHPDSGREIRTPMEGDGSDADEAFEDQATEMGIEKGARIPSSPASSGSRYDSANV